MRMTGRRTGSRAAATLAALAVATVGLATPVLAVDTALGDPVLELGFEGNATDTSPLAHPTSFVGTNYSWVDGVEAGSQALKFGGSTYLDLGSSVELQPEDLTLSFWLKPSATMSGESIISWNKSTWNSDGWYLSSEGNDVPLALSIGPASSQPYKVRVSSNNRATFFPTNEWTHVVVTYDHVAKAVAFYRNGEKVASHTANAIGGDATGVLGSSESLPKTIGFNGPVYNGAYMTQALDEYRLYNGVATLEDVAALYEDTGRTIDYAALATSAADALSIPELVTADLSLPTVAVNGSTVTWTSSHQDVIANDGTVHRPEDADVSVTLTASVSYAGGPAVTREFPVTVTANLPVLEDSGLSAVQLTDEYMVNAASNEAENLLDLSSDKFLYWFYRTAISYGAEVTPPTTEGYGGWENGNVSGNFRGHAFGHYMSALAMSYASSDDATLKADLMAEIEAAVDGAMEVQATYDGTDREGYFGPFRDSALDQVEGVGTSDDPVVVPYYNLHKVFAGLLDIHEWVGGETGDQALEVAEKFGEYMYGRVSALSSTSALLSIEYGGMNDAFYELFDLTGNTHFLEVAEAFDETALFEQLAAGIDPLNGKHANTTIPKLIGALKRYTVFTQNPEYYAMLTEEEKSELSMYYNAASNFFDIVIEDHTYATGANSQGEHFHAADSLYQYATEMGGVGNPQTAETCNEYNMLKLARELFVLTRDVKYADYYENTFINTILSSQNPDTGQVTYFQAMAPGYYKLYSQPFTDFWCCWGTGQENFSKLGDSIYYTSGNTVFVNMFLGSTFDYDAANMRVAIDANLPTSDTVTFEVSALSGDAVADDAALRLRIPDWLAGDYTVTVNDAVVTPEASRGYLLVPVAAGDVVEYTLPMEVRVIETSDNANFVAFKYGPVLLSAGLGTENMAGYTGVGIGVRVPVVDPEAQTSIVVAQDPAEWKSSIADNLVRIEDSEDGQVQFVLENTFDGDGLVFTPHYRRHDERYMLYTTIEAPDSAESQARILDAKEAARENARVIDGLTSFDNNNYEAAKNKKQSTNSTVGVWDNRQFRHAPGSTGWFSYDLEIDPEASANYLRSDLYTGDSGRTWAIYLNDELFATETVTNAAGSNVFYGSDHQIPQKYIDNPRWKVDTNGNQVLDPDGDPIPVVTVRFQSTGGWAGGVFGVYTLRPDNFDLDPSLSALSFDSGALSPAFDPEETDYTLTVPQGTASVGMNVSPHTPIGLVYVDDVLIDDTRTRQVPLAPEGDTTLEIVAKAEDHETAETYTVSIVEAPSLTLRDIATNPFKAEIEWLAATGVTTGWATSTPGVADFRPLSNVNRDQMAAFLYRLAGEPEFAAPEEPTFLDVPTDYVFYKEIEWLATTGVTEGWTVDEGAVFRPRIAVNRDVMAAFLYRYADSPDFDAPAVSPFVDVKTNHVFYKEIAWLNSTGISQGWTVDGDKQFRTTTPVKRDVMAAFLFRYADQFLTD